MKTIVIVDDSRTARMFVRRCLEIAGCQDATFLEAGNGKEALGILKDNQVNFVVSDLNMPVLDGETLLKLIKSSPKLTSIPVVIITSASNPAKDRSLVELGAFAVISKPISPAQVSGSLASLISA